MGFNEAEFVEDEEGIEIDLNEEIDGEDEVLGYNDDDDDGPSVVGQEDEAEETAPPVAPQPAQFQMPVAPTPPTPPAPPTGAESVSERNRLAAAYRIQKRDFEILQRRHEQLVTALAAQHQAPVEEEAEEAIPDPEENLAGHLVGKVNRLERLTQREADERKEREERARVAGISAQAAQGAMQVREVVGGEVFDDALGHLGRSLTMEARLARPDLTDAEIQQGLNGMLQNKIREWGENGLNVGEQLLQYSYVRGWQPKVPQPAVAPAVVTAPAVVGVAPGRRTTDPREEVRKQRDKQKTGRTISSVPGTPAKGKFDVAKYSIGSSEEDWDRTVATLTQKAGAGYGQKRPSIGQLLAHKAVRGS